MINEQSNQQALRIAAVVVAGGRGQRAGGGVAKQYRQIGGRAMIRRAIEALVAAGVETIQPVIHPDDGDLYAAAMAGGPATLDPVPGGDTRQASGLCGLRALIDHAPDLVLIHDAARPFADPPLINRVIAGLGEDAAVIPTLPVVDTLRRGDNAGSAGETVSRDGLWRVQTPQGFRFSEILAAHEAALAAPHEMTDDAAVAALHGLGVKMVPGSEDNMKVTTAEDFARAERMLEGEMETRTGFGFDVHRFGDGAFVTLCGIEVPHSAGLVGHSDADVAWHALTDALLGAIGAGDIGTHFPPSDPAFKGAPSSRFLAHAGDLVAAAGGRIVNADVTIICEAPKIGTHRDAMIASTADVLGVEATRLSIKATTTEKLGFTGRGEGIAAQAIVTIRVPLR